MHAHEHNGDAIEWHQHTKAGDYAFMPQVIHVRGIPAVKGDPQPVSLSLQAS